MSSDSFITVGKSIYPGREVRIICTKGTHVLEEESLENRFRIVYIKEGYGVFRNGESSQIVTSPMVLCLNEKDKVRIENATNLTLETMYFDPICYERYRSYDSIESWKQTLGEDEFYFRPFFERNDTYIGALAINHYLGNRVSQLISLTDALLSRQKDSFWPCRSRSYFIELLLLMSSIYIEDSAHEQVFTGKMTGEMKEVVDWLHLHYMDKIVMEDVTREFHTNKTTLNQKFKSVMGVTVMEYVQKFKLTMACSLLRKTFLPVKEIMERAGYRDDAHFLRSFKKYAGCTPSEYRERFNQE